MSKTLFMEKLCVHLKLPMIKLVDGASGGGSITNYRTEQGSYLPQLELLSWLVRTFTPCPWPVGFNVLTQGPSR